MSLGVHLESNHTQYLYSPISIWTVPDWQMAFTPGNKEACNSGNLERENQEGRPFTKNSLMLTGWRVLYRFLSALLLKAKWDLVHFLEACCEEQGLLIISKTTVRRSVSLIPRTLSSHSCILYRSKHPWEFYRLLHTFLVLTNPLPNEGYIGRQAGR